MAVHTSPMVAETPNSPAPLFPATTDPAGSMLSSYARCVTYTTLSPTVIVAVRAPPFPTYGATMYITSPSPVPLAFPKITSHDGSDDTAVHETCPSGWIEIESSPPSVPNSFVSYSTSTPRAFCVTLNVLRAIVTVPLFGYTVVFGDACSVTVPGPTRFVDPDTVSHAFVFWICHSTMSATDTLTEQLSPAAANSYPFADSADTAAGCVTVCVFALTFVSPGVTTIFPVRWYSVGFGAAEYTTFPFPAPVPVVE